jgi:hypothetical protein
MAVLTGPFAEIGNTLADTPTLYTSDLMHRGLQVVCLRPLHV